MSKEPIHHEPARRTGTLLTRKSSMPPPSQLRPAMFVLAARVHPSRVNVSSDASDLPHNPSACRTGGPADGLAVLVTGCRYAARHGQRQHHDRHRERRHPTQQTRRPALSPSRASDFKQCPLLYRFRAVDRLPEPPTKAQVRGTPVHSVLNACSACRAPTERPNAPGNYPSHLVAVVRGVSE